MKKKLSGFLVLVFIISITACGGSKVPEITWPSSEIAGLLPKPESMKGEISFDSETYLSINIANTPKDAFEAYIDACKGKGFTEDYFGHDGFCSANNEDGYSLILNYDEKKKEMSITLSSPPEVEGDEDIEETTETESTENTDTNDESSTSSGADLRAFMDSYEAYMDEYVAFMKKYKENPTDIKLLTDYGKMMENYAEFTEKAGAIKEGDYSTEDYKYYLEVLNRCNQKLVEVL